jgi:hypothetical protein
MIGFGQRPALAREFARRNGAWSHGAGRDNSRSPGSGGWACHRGLLVLVVVRMRVVDHDVLKGLDVF